MFGGIPNSEIAEFNKYWHAFPSLKDQIFESINRDFSNPKSDNIKQIITDNDGKVWKVSDTDFQLVNEIEKPKHNKK